MPSVNGTNIAWGDLRRDARVERTAPIRPVAKPAAAYSEAVKTKLPVASDNPVETIKVAPAAVVRESAELPSLINLYAHAQVVNAPDQHGALITLAPEGVAPPSVPEQAARTSAEIMARASYALVAGASRQAPARLSRQG